MRSLELILTDLADHLDDLADLKGADAYFPDRMGNLPRALLLAENSEISMEIASLLVVRHHIDAYIVAAGTRASIALSVEARAELLDNVVTHLYSDITLGGTVTQLWATDVRPATINLGGEQYYASVLSIIVEEKSTLAVS